MAQLDREIKACEDKLVEQEESLEVAEMDFTTCEHLRDEVINVDSLSVDIAALDRRIVELKNQVRVWTSAKSGLKMFVEKKS